MTSQQSVKLEQQIRLAEVPSEPTALGQSTPGGGGLRAIVEHVQRGGLLVIPTESSYGLAVDPRSEVGVELVYRVKQRERGKPLPVVAGTVDQVRDLVGGASSRLLEWAAERWPAPLTVLIDCAKELPAQAGSSRLAIRIPAHEGLRRLLESCGPLTATSANLSGEPPILDPEGLGDVLGDHPAIVLDDGILPGGAPSTMVSCADGRLQVLREGRFLIETNDFRTACGKPCGEVR